MGQIAAKLVLTHAKGQEKVVRIFFTLTFKAVGVTFLEVIFGLPKDVLNWSNWISPAVTFQSIVCQCMQDNGAKKVILIKIWSDLLYFLSLPVLLKFCLLILN